MLIQTEKTPNPNTMKFIPGKKVSESGSIEFVDKKETDNELVRNLLSVNGITMVFLGSDFITIKKKDNENWDNLKHIVISFINDYYLTGAKIVLKDKSSSDKKDSPKDDIVNKINNILDSKIRPAVARDGGDIKFKSFNKGIVTVELKGSCSGCPSSVITLKNGVQNLLCHYIPEVKEVEALSNEN